SITVIVSGYDKSLPEDTITSLLREHFSSCGEITKVYLHAHADSKIHNKYAFVDIIGVGPKEKALHLSGSDVGGHKLLVKFKPVSTKYFSEFTHEEVVDWSELNEISRNNPRPTVVMVSGYDTRLPEESVSSALSKHFSSCGEVDLVIIGINKDGDLRDTAGMEIWGEGVAEKARELSGSDMGGWKVVVGNCSGPRDVRLNEIHREKVDFGPWGKPVYGGTAKAGIAAFPGVSFYVPFKNKKGEAGPIVAISLPVPAMESFSDFQNVLRDLSSRHGPIITLHVGSKPSIWLTDKSLAHEALVQNGAVFSDRPLALPTTKVITSNQHDIHSSVYGSLWRTLRRNLTSEILQPARVKAHAPSRKWALEILTDLFETEQRDKGYVFNALEHLRHAMFCLLALMCFGEKLKREEIREIEEAQYQMLISYSKFSVLNIFPSVTKFLLKKKWREFLDLRKSQESVILRYVNARSQENASDVLCYVDTLLSLEIPMEEEEGKKRKLSESEIVSLCSEFLNAATDPTATAMQWIMAVMVKYPEIQGKVYEEMKSVVTGEEEEIKEEELGKLSYLKAVILESLGRHPPGHYLSYHKVTNDTVLGGFLVPREGMFSQ
ncbi:hypothetical protein AALP_AAs43288U000100, partial [Arabis alpina]